jgi:hypothetical protein
MRTDLAVVSLACVMHKSPLKRQKHTRNELCTILLLALTSGLCGVQQVESALLDPNVKRPKLYSLTVQTVPWSLHLSSISAFSRAHPIPSLLLVCCCE